MPKILVLFYSRTGNTERMARAVLEGIKKAERVEAEMDYYVPPEKLENFDALVIGSPTYHHDMPIDIKNILEEAATKKINLKGKVGAAFGSYGWSGEAPHMVLEVLRNKFEMMIVEPPLLIKYTPDQGGLEKCRELGSRIAERIKRGEQ